MAVRASGVSRYRQRPGLALWLALAAMLLRALLPSAYMPGRESPEGGYGLVLCSAALPAQGLQTQFAPHHASSGLCSFAHSAMAALPDSAWRWQLPPTQDERPQDRVALHAPLQSRLYPQARGPPASS